LVTCASRHEGYRGRNQKSEAVRKIVEDYDGLARIDELMDHVAADVAGTPCDQNRHIKRFS
jgi:hypothetical protein